MIVTGFRSLCLSLLLLLGLNTTVFAWDATAHRLSAYATWEALTASEQNKLLAILAQHPRYQQDFLDSMPVNIMVADERTQARWLFGQAAIWPDTARSLEGEEALRFNRPTWHFIDGAWIRGDTQQGNVYVGAEPLPSIHGESSAPISDEADVSNVVQGIEYNLAKLRDPLRATSERAVALSWVLHLVGDIHQPLHSGALISSSLFPNGDRGGNRIPTQAANLHSRWDGALRNKPFEDTFRRMHSGLQQHAAEFVDMNIDTWLQESRQVLYEFVYIDKIKAAVLRSERLDEPLPPFVLDDDYTSKMQALSEERLTLAATRLFLMLRDALKD